MYPDPGSEVLQGSININGYVYILRSPDYRRSGFPNLSFPRNDDLRVHEPIQIIN